MAWAAVREVVDSDVDELHAVSLGAGERQSMDAHAAWQPERRPEGCTVSEAVVKSGELLLALGRMHVRFISVELATHCQKHFHLMPDCLSYGSACSGSGMDGIVMDTIAAVLREKHIYKEFIAEMMCEINPGKRAWLLDWTSPSEHLCCFGDIEGLLAPAAPCYAHGISSVQEPASKRSRPSAGSRDMVETSPAACEVPSVDVFFCGSSCKYFSNMGAHTRQHGAASTFLARHSPSLTEMVNSMDGHAKAAKTLVSIV